MYRKRKNNSKKKYIIAISIFVVIIFAIVVNLNPNRNLTFVEKAFKDGVLFVEKIIKAPFNYLKSDQNRTGILALARPCTNHCTTPA
ncbi:unknown [Acholeplasma sp. CAG:878]|nr:unknown [Acholeplasma sp. CAG:878]